MGYAMTIDLNKYNVLILPNGNYASIFDKKQMNKLESWVERGGKIVVMGSAISAFATSDGSSGGKGPKAFDAASWGKIGNIGGQEIPSYDLTVAVATQRR